MWVDLVCDGLRKRLSSIPQWRGTVAGIADGCGSAAKAANELAALIAELRELLGHSEELDGLCRSYIEDPAKKIGKHV